MKNFIFVLSTALSLTASAFDKQHDTTTCLIVYGNALIKGKPVGEIMAKLYCDNEEINSQMICDQDDKFVYELKRNRYYTVKIFKTGFITRSVSINTSLPEHVRAKPIFIFNFQVELLPETKNINNEFVDFPIAIIEYRIGKDVFDYSKKYTEIVKSELSQDYNDFVTKNNR